MEINKYREIVGVVTVEAIPEGRMVNMVATDASESHNYGSREDLPGVRLPDTQAEAAQAHFVVAFAVDNTKPPIYEPMPAFDWALREGWDQAANVPFDAAVHMTQPSMTLGQTIPSGSLALAFGPGVYTVPSGAFVYSAAITVPGAWLEVANDAEDSAADAGKLMADADGSEGKFAQVERYDSSDGSLTFRINW
jgi:hypothetical protein